jgi:pimeloyl-ACP methyl ester carboxylesterase
LVVESLQLEPFCLLAHSLGVPVAIAYAARNRERMKALILLDYPARYPARSAAWLERALPFARERGIPEHVVKAIAGEAERTELWDELRAIARPILLVKGGRSPAISYEDLHRFRETPGVRVEVFEESGHEIHQPDYGRFIGTIEGFLAELDRVSA